MGRMPPQNDEKMNPLVDDATNITSSDCDESSSFFFLSPSAATQLPLFQYKGEDRSLLYHYVLSPLAAFCVNHLTPRTLAPNTITLTGLVFMIAAYSSMWYHAPTLLQVEDAQDLPRWIFLLNGMSMLIYQTLDNMDGKQARRTGSSSPLGLMFDHGCDAINSVFGSVNWMVAMALNPASDIFMCWSILFGPYGLFFIGTWEEFYTGELIMPIVNGPNEGLMGGALLSLTSWYWGPTYWHGHDWWESWIQPVLAHVLPASFLSWLPASAPRNADLLVLGCSIGFVQEIILKTISVVRTYRLRALWNLLPFFILTACSLLVGIADYQVFLDMPRTSLHLCAALFVEMATALMLAHTTEQEYQPFRWILLPLVLLTTAVVSGQWHAGKETADFLLVYTTAATTFLVCKTVIIVQEICTVLNIWCFDIVTPRSRASRATTATATATATTPLQNGRAKNE
jgi:ethanolaminephosphotransferase